MKNKKKIIEEIKAVGLKVKILSFGFCVYPGDRDEDNAIYTNELDKLLVIAQKYGLGHYINFDDGFVRLH